MKHIDKFLSYLKLSHYAIGTIAGYQIYLKKLDNFLKKRLIEDEKEVNVKDIIDFLTYLKKA